MDQLLTGMNVHEPANEIFGVPLGPRKQVDNIELISPQAKTAICREKYQRVINGLYADVKEVIEQSEITYGDGRKSSMFTHIITLLMKEARGDVNGSLFRILFVLMVLK